METEKPKRWPFHKVTCCDDNGDAGDVDADDVDADDDDADDDDADV